MVSAGLGMLRAVVLVTLGEMVKRSPAWLSLSTDGEDVEGIGSVDATPGVEEDLREW